MYLPSSLLPLVAELKVQNEIKCMITLKKFSIINYKLLINTLFVYPASCQLTINSIFKLDRGFEVVLLLFAKNKKYIYTHIQQYKQSKCKYPSIAKLAYIHVNDGSILKEYKKFNLTYNFFFAFIFS